MNEQRKKQIEVPDKPVPTFVFARVNPNSLTREGGNLLVSKLLNALGRDRVKDEFVRYKAIVQNNGKIPRAQQETIEQIIPGQIGWLPLKSVGELLAEKETHARAAFRNPGHKSTYAPDYLSDSRTVLIIGGDERFLAQQIYFNFERTGWLYKRAVELILRMLDLKEDGTARKWENNTYLEYRPKRREEMDQFYPGNFNRMWQEVLKLRETVSEDELFARIGFQANAKADAESF